MTLDKLGTELVDEFMREINEKFYFSGPKKAFFWDRSLLIQAIQFPAVYLFDRGIRREFPVERYRELLTGIIDGIYKHGNSKVEHFGRYFLTCVQTHMRSHHGDDYYQEAIATRNVCAGIDAGKVFKKKTPVTDSTIEVLATAAKLAAQKRGRKKAKLAPTPQLDLFACTPSAPPLQSPSRRPA
ncbi:MAG TPA: hypothetical protein VHY22_05435 [Chthoniobacteraceae bacterium]|jgi:hypothetical protein|nr:hypothetical protein [Chthoniobacteraceae bacterium]